MLSNTPRATDRREALPHWRDQYKGRRSHFAHGHRPPIEGIRDVLGFDI